MIDSSLAVEAKATDRISDRHLVGLRALGEEKLVPNRVVVSRDPIRRRTEDGIEIIPWDEFLTGLWVGEWSA